MKNENAVVSAQTLARSGAEPGSRWQHYGGGTYRVVACAVDEPTLTPVIVYKSEQYGHVWVRTLEDWQAWVTWPDGSYGHRFKRLPEEPQKEEDDAGFSIIHNY